MYMRPRDKARTIGRNNSIEFRMHIDALPLSFNRNSASIPRDKLQCRRRRRQRIAERHDFATTNFRVKRLKMLPNMSAIRVLLMMITLYGMLKSGVATSTRSVGVYVR